jgi:hypothetical protein
MEAKVAGGYVLITVGQLANVCAARKSGAISFLALRVWLATHEQCARRINTELRNYKSDELVALIAGGVTRARIQRAIRELVRENLLSFTTSVITHATELRPDAATIASELGTNPGRRVPIPRRLLRALFRHKRPSEVMAAIGHLVRCLFKRGRKISNYGLVKASWIASLFGVAERSVHSARKWLRAAGFLTEEYVHQVVKNRWGGKFVVNLSPALQANRAGRTKFAAPFLTKNPYRSLYQTERTEQYETTAGVCRERESGASSGEPDLKNILPDDLRKLERLETLYRLAVKARWLTDSEAGFRNFVSAALRATRAGGRVGAIFVGIVKRGLWQHVTQEQERDALAVLRRYRERHDAFRSRDATGSSTISRLSPICELVGTVLKRCEL